MARTRSRCAIGRNAAARSAGPWCAAFRLLLRFALTEALDQHTAPLAVGEQPGARLFRRSFSRLFVVAARAAEFAPQLLGWAILFGSAPGVRQRSRSRPNRAAWFGLICIITPRGTPTGPAPFILQRPLRGWLRMTVQITREIGLFGDRCGNPCRRAPRGARRAERAAPASALPQPPPRPDRRVEKGRTKSG